MVRGSSKKSKDAQQAAKAWWERIKEALQDLAEINIATKADGEEYKTTIKLDGDVENDFGKIVNRHIWDRHNAIVDHALQTRKEIILKLIDKIPSLPKFG